MKRVVVSGGFDPLHIGHVNLFKAARELGDWLCVIVNNDTWLLRKKGYVFMPESERAQIVLACRYVDEVVMSRHTVNERMSVSLEIAMARPNVFANGGDVTVANPHEDAICKHLGIKQVFNVGGAKVQSSSDLIKRLWQGIRNDT